MNKDVMNPGEFLILETGEYSDSTWTGPFIVVREIDKAKVADEYRATCDPDPYTEDAATPEGFIGWLAKSGYIVDVPTAHRWHVGSCGEFAP